MRKELVNICLGFPADELEALNQLVAKLDISFAEFMSRLVVVAEEADRPWHFYPRNFRIPKGHRAVRKSFKVIPEVRDRANRLAEIYKITTSELLRVELQQANVLDAVKVCSWRPEPRTWTPRASALPPEPLLDDELDDIEDPEPTPIDLLIERLGAKPCRCGGEMYPRLVRKDFFCCNCRNKEVLIGVDYAVG